MGIQIIRQPNNKYTLFSTNADDTVLVNASRDECIEYILKQEMELRIKMLLDAFDKISSGHSEKVYFQFTLTWENVLQAVKDIHGEDYLRKFIEETKE